MNLPKYSEYKKTNVEWLTEVPAHWNIQSCRGVLTDRNERNEPLINENYLSLMANIGIILYEEKGDVGNKKPEDLGKCKQVYPGDLVINSMNYGIGSYGLSKHRGVCSPVYIVLTPKLNKVEERYAFRILEIKKFQQYAQSFGNGILEHRASISWDILKNIGLPLPPIDEQRNILQFLDIEIAKIDNLVKDQEKMIELLKEKLQAVISNAVTKGLDPKVKMKDSGVVWLGDIPEHWKIYRIKNLLSVLTDYTANGSFASLAENVTYQTSGYSRLVRLTDLRENLDNEGLFVDENAHNFLKKSELVGGEVLIANVGAYAGFACLMPSINMKATLGPNMYLMKFKKSLLSNEYALLVLMSFHAQEQLKISATSTAQPKLNKDDVKEIWIALPTELTEQNNILSYVDSQKHSFESLIEQAKLGINLLHERRSALISAAVTGQIDVRNYQLKEAS